MGKLIAISCRKMTKFFAAENILPDVRARNRVITVLIIKKRVDDFEVAAYVHVLCA
jgi:hypothetical protein